MAWRGDGRATQLAVCGFAARKPACCDNPFGTPQRARPLGLPEGRAHAAATTKEPSKWPSCCRTTGSRRAEHSSDKRRAGQGVFPGRLQTAHNRSGTASAAGVKVCLPDANEQQLPLGQEGRQPGQDLFHDVLWHGNCESFRMGKIPSARDREHDGDAGQPVELAW